jgi:uncharacterized protein involved in exopolysaccharide biosynthesis
MARGSFASGTTETMRPAVPPLDTSVFDHLRVIYRYRWIILIVCFLSAGITGVVCFTRPPTFEAMASVVSPPDLQGEMGLAGGMLGIGEAALLRQITNTASVADMYAGILQSRVVTDAIIDKFDLKNVYKVGSRTKARRRLQHKTKVNVSEDGILSVTVVDRDRDRAAAMANAYVQELDCQNKRLSAGQATSKRIFVEKQLKEVEQKLSRVDTLLLSDAKVQEMLHELFVREYEIAKIEEAKSMPTIQVLDTASPPETRRARGTVRKAGLAGIVALVCTIFFAFSREYIRACRQRERQGLSMAELGESATGRVTTNATDLQIPAPQEGGTQTDRVCAKPFEATQAK